MQPRVKHIPNSQFSELVAMYVELNKGLNNPAPAMYALTHDLAHKPDFVALGLYEEDNLNGFVTGYALSKETFYFSGIFVKTRNRNARLLIEKSLEYVDSKGYISWEADCTNTHILRILYKYNAKNMYIRVKNTRRI